MPSDTYTLLRLGAAERLVARTRYCVAPAHDVDRIAVVGGTKAVDVRALLALLPDIVVANQEENRQSDIERIERAGVPVLLSFPCTVAAGLEHAVRLAALLPDRRALAAPALSAARAELGRLVDRRRDGPHAVPTFLPIWKDPLMTANGASFLSDALALSGAENVFAGRSRRHPLAADLRREGAAVLRSPAGRDVRYPRVSLEEVAVRAPELVLLPDEPYCFDEHDAAVFRELPGGPEVCFCDGKDLMWYGLRCIEGLSAVADMVSAARQARRAGGVGA